MKNKIFTADMNSYNYNCFNARLIAYITTHKTITVEQQASLTNWQVLSLCSLLEQQERQQTSK